MGLGTRHPTKTIPWVSSQTHQPCPEFLPVFVHSRSSPSVPKNDQESLNCPQATLWETARHVQEEQNACKANSVWSEPMKLPYGKKAANLGFIYVVKNGGDNSFLTRYKARLVFRNHKFATESSWEQSFSPVVAKTTLQLFFTMVGRNNLFLRQVDIITAYLNTEMPDEVYIKLPSICGDDADMVRRLLHALFGHPKA